MRRRTALLALAACALLALALPAGAHTELESVTPEDGSSVADPPAEVVLVFTEPLADPEAAQVEVIDPLGDDLVAAPPVVEGAVVTVPLNQAVAEGPHEVRYVVIAEDGHRIEGTTTFTFAPPAAVATPTATLPPDPDPAEVITPGPTADAQPTAAPTPVASPPEPTPEPSPVDAEEAASGGGIPPVAGIVVAILVVAAVGAVLLRRSRGDAGLGG